MNENQLKEACTKIWEIIKDLPFEERERLSRMIGCIEDVWIVTFYYQDGRTPDISVFSNQEGAKDYYDSRENNPFFEGCAEIRKYQIYM